MKRPSYAIGQVRHWCDRCCKARSCTPVSAWEKCEGAGPNRELACDYCRLRMTEWEPCMHRADDPRCAMRHELRTTEAEARAEEGEPEEAPGAVH